MQTLKRSSFLIMALSHLLLSCSTTQKGKALEYGLLGGLIGGIYGASREESLEQNISLYGSLGALTGVALATAMDESDAKIKDLETKLKFVESTQKTAELKNSKDFSIEDLPEDYKLLLQSQDYEVFRINNWTRRGSNYLVKESQMIELKGKR